MGAKTRIDSTSGPQVLTPGADLARSSAASKAPQETTCCSYSVDWTDAPQWGQALVSRVGRSPTSRAAVGPGGPGHVWWAAWSLSQVAGRGPSTSGSRTGGGAGWPREYRPVSWLADRSKPAGASSPSPCGAGTAAELTLAPHLRHHAKPNGTTWPLEQIRCSGLVGASIAACHPVQPLR